MRQLSSRILGVVVLFCLLGCVAVPTQPKLPVVTTHDMSLQVIRYQPNVGGENYQYAPSRRFYINNPSHTQETKK